jgi:hypothetical protein
LRAIDGFIHPNHPKLIYQKFYESLPQKVVSHRWFGQIGQSPPILLNKYCGISSFVSAIHSFRFLYHFPTSFLTAHVGCSES